MGALPTIVQGLDGLPVVLQLPAELLRVRGLRRDPLLAYAVLWNLAGCRPGRLTIDYLRFRITMGASEHGVRRWLKSLEGAGLIDVLDRQPRQAEIRVRDWRQPRTTAPPVPPSAAASQLALPFADRPAPPADAGPATISFWTPIDRRPRSAPSDRPTAG